MTTCINNSSGLIHVHIKYSACFFHGGENVNKSLGPSRLLKMKRGSVPTVHIQEERVCNEILHIRVLNIRLTAGEGQQQPAIPTQ